MRTRALGLACVVAAGTLGAPPWPGQAPYGILPLEPASPERSLPVERLKARAPALSEAFSSHVHSSASGERMPYRLFSPAEREKGLRYPLVVFLHGAGGSGTDNARQLQDANVFGALVWTLPENQQRHPAFVVAPQSNWNWPCTIFDPKNDGLPGEVTT